MKGYRIFILLSCLLLIFYIVFEISKPTPVDWSVSLSKEDKNPYGAYILYQQLHDLFPGVTVNSFRLPVYNQLNDFHDSNTAYLLIDPELDLSEEDVEALFNYASAGNYVFISAAAFSQKFSDSLKINTSRKFTAKNFDSVRINFTNPSLKATGDYKFKRFTIDGYFDKFDTAISTVLGSNQFNDVNFLRVNYGSGAFFIHAAPICFSNYFMLTRDNSDYTAKALSYLPENVNKIFWDEYYKLGPEGSQNPLRFILSNIFLRWAFRIALFTMIIFVLFEMKRKQRIIPVIEPLRNSTLDFVQTVGNVYFNRHDNKNIAEKKIRYFFEFIRSRFYLSTTSPDADFIKSLSKKSGIAEHNIAELINFISFTSASEKINDTTLLQLNNQIDLFYKNAK